MEKMKTLCLLFSIMLACSEAANILAVFPVPSKSHGILGDGIVRHLLNAGHEVTYITPFTYKNPPAKLRTIDVSSNFDLIPPDLINVKGIMEKTSPEMSSAIMLYIVVEFIKKTVLNEDVQKLLNDPKEHFNLVIAEFMGDTPAGFLDRRQENAYHSLFGPLVEKRGRKLASYEEARFNASLVLSNAYVTTSGGASLPQSHKFIGGYHVEDTVKPLPEDLKKLMDRAKDGVIYFSLGSNLKSKDLPDELKVSLLKMFGSLKQTVIWKFEEVLPNLPKNVHILKWAPQQSILAHPNLAVFITHGGLLSTTEAIHFGVPIIGIPVYGDQFMNVDKAVNRGFAQRVDLSYAMVDKLKDTIEEVLNNKRYAAKAKELSFIHHDRPVKPAQELVHWVNHVMNTRGAPHLRSPALDLPFYNRWFLDLAALIAVFLFAIFILLKHACAYVCSRLCSAKGKTGSKKKNH